MQLKGRLPPSNTNEEEGAARFIQVQSVLAT